VFAAWWGVIHHGALRAIGLGLAVLLLLGAVALIVFEGKAFQDLLVLALAVLALAMARRAFLSRADLPDAARPDRAVLFYNPKSGGGKATRFHLADEAQKRGIRAVELKLGEDLRELVRRAIADGADALAMAGGDGSQAIVADEAAIHGLPYACIPSGTRNHFALDLGLNRNDLVGSLDAFTDGIERRIDVAEVNGRLFLNNVSLGIYGDAVREPGYRDAKARTLLETASRVLGPSAPATDLEVTDDCDRIHRDPEVVLVSNNPYALEPPHAPGTRPRLDGGELGIIVLDRPHAVPEPRPAWTATRVEVAGPAPAHAGIDGEAVDLTPPLRFVTLPGALRVRVPAQP
jgi:diacylglycerol kinase family enzyme